MCELINKSFLNDDMKNKYIELINERIGRITAVSLK